MSDTSSDSNEFSTLSVPQFPESESAEDEDDMNTTDDFRRVYLYLAGVLWEFTFINKVINFFYGRYFKNNFCERKVVIFLLYQLLCYLNTDRNHLNLMPEINDSTLN